MTRVLVFGTFDGLHPGHESFLTQAAELGNELIVCAAQDEVVRKLKGKEPQFPLPKRLAALQRFPAVFEARGGDLELGTYQSFQEVRPDVVAFGYDQDALRQDFKRFQQETGDETPTVVLKPYRPEVYKSSLLRPEP